MTATSLPRASTRLSSGAAPLRADGARMLQVVLTVAGGVLLPLGLVVIMLGWYGAAHSPYEYDQLSYLVSGGLLGLGLTFCGGFLYFGSWLARIAADQKEASTRLSDTLLVLGDAVARQSAGNDAPDERDPGAVGRRTAGLSSCRLCGSGIH